MRTMLASLLGMAFLAACSSVPMQTAQPEQAAQGTCDNEKVARVETARQPILVERCWVNCPKAAANDKPSS